ncbi:MAG: tRNA (adenosine(37)-N6)-threonylcarbamoyltransferase complex transferase subunit TsaD [Planctomycetota bacterium]
MPTILAIETSCDETAVAIVDHEGAVRCNLIATQFDVHAKYGGVVPELASRAHIEKLDLLVREGLEQARCTPANIDAIAVTRSPGLIGSLLVGLTAAKTLAWSWGKPLIGINHVHAHATSAAIGLSTAPWPAVALVVSGGHTSLYHVSDYDDIRLLGRTIDDAAGEAFDKVATILDLGYPGGPVVDRRATAGNPEAVAFPRTLLGRDSLDFSFSGLKTAVLYHVHGPGKTTGGLARLSAGQVDDICASFSAAVADVLVEKTLRAVARTKATCVVIGGGVAANSTLRDRLSRRCRRNGVVLHLTPLDYCTDNAVMVATLAGHLMERGRVDDLRLTALASGEPA